MKKTLFIIFLSFIYGQGFDLSGRIISKSTLNPIQDVNIFIQDSELGSASNKEGLFKFTGLESDDYILIVLSLIHI